MRNLAGSEVMALIHAIDPEKWESGVICPICKSKLLDIQRVDKPNSTQFSLVIGCTKCDYCTHFGYCEPEANK